MLLPSLRTCMTDNFNSKNLDLRVFLHWPSKPLPSHDGCLTHGLSVSWRKRNTWDSRAEKDILKGNTRWSGRRSQAKTGAAKTNGMDIAGDETVPASWIIWISSLGFVTGNTMLLWYYWFESGSSLNVHHVAMLWAMDSSLPLKRVSATPVCKSQVKDAPGSSGMQGEALLPTGNATEPICGCELLFNVISSKSSSWPAFSCHFYLDLSRLTP